MMLMTSDHAYPRSGYAPARQSQWNLDNLFDSIPRFGLGDWFDSDLPYRSNNSACQIDEEKDHYLLRLETPGLSRDNLEIETTSDTLTISARVAEKEGASSKGSQKNAPVVRRYPSFKRIFSLPQDAQGAPIDAAYADGVLQIRISKTPRAATKRIQIGEQLENRVQSSS